MASQAQQNDGDAGDNALSEAERPISKRASSWTPEAVLRSGLVLIASTIRNKSLPMHQRLQAARVAMTTLHDAGIKPSERDLRVVFRRAARLEEERKAADDDVTLADLRDAERDERYAQAGTSVYTAERNDSVTDAAPGQREVQSEVLRPPRGTTQTDPAQNSLSPRSESHAARAERELRDYEATIAQHRVASVPVARCEHLSSKNAICGRKLPCALHTPKPPKYEPW